VVGFEKAWNTPMWKGRELFNKMNTIDSDM
jgi:hypothetical protein